MNYVFYPGCAYHSSAGYPQSVAALGRALDFRLIDIDDWNCCGATAQMSMDLDKALALNARVFALAERQGVDEFVTVCNACHTTLRKGRDKLLKSPEALAEVNRRLQLEGLRLTKPPRVLHLLEVLLRDVPDETWAAKRSEAFAGLPAAAYYGCQLTRPWGIGAGEPDDPQEPRLLDRFFEKLGLAPVEHSARTMCCGASHMVSNPKSCRTLVKRLVTGMRMGGAKVAATICPMCQFNVDSGQQEVVEPLPMLYFTQLAGLALGLPPRDLGLDKLLTPVDPEGLKTTAVKE